MQHMTHSETIPCDLAVIGTGMAGMAAALFAANRELKVVQIGRPKGILLSSGLLDLLGVHPMEEKRIWTDPWAAMERLATDLPMHPFAHLKKESILAAFKELFDFLTDNRLPYCRHRDQNATLITSLGTVKTTYGVPKTMWNGVQAFEKRLPTLLIDFLGLKDFSARRIMTTQKDRWPGLRAARISFPGNHGGGEFFAGEITARVLERREARQQLLQAIKPHIKDAVVVGIPSILGLRHSHEILSELEKEMGLPMFEISTIPPSVPGLRLKEVFEEGLQAKGVRMFLQEQVLSVDRSDQKNFTLHLDTKRRDQRIQAKAVILATGRFLGGGLQASRKGIREALFDLPVFQPKERKEWHRKDLLDTRGHRINQAGLETDHTFRPLNKAGVPHFPNLFAAGSILGHQDWMRMKCGSGLAVATAYGAVISFSKAEK